MQQHASNFFEQAEAAAGADLPQFVRDEFDAFSNAASWRTASRACAATISGTTSWWCSA